MTEILQVTNINAQDLINRFDEILEQQIKKLQKENPQPKENKNEYLKRAKVAEIFGVSTVTIWEWSKKGILKSYKIANRVYFKRNEIDQALIKMGGK